MVRKRQSTLTPFPPTPFLIQTRSGRSPMAAPRSIPLSPLIVVRMRPDIRRNLALFRQPNHVHRRAVARRSAGPAAKRGFQFPDRRIARPAHRIERDAGAGLAALAHHLQPAVTAVEALCDRRRGLGRSTKTLHLFGPQQAFGSVGRANGFLGALAGTLRANPRAHDPIAENSLSGFSTHGRITAGLAAPRNATRIRCQARPRDPKVWSNVQPLFHYHQSGRHSPAVRGPQQQRRQPAADAWRVSGLPRAGDQPPDPTVAVSREVAGSPPFPPSGWVTWMRAGVLPDRKIRHA
jgi:hypothetical protein